VRDQGKIIAKGYEFGDAAPAVSMAVNPSRPKKLAQCTKKLRLTAGRPKKLESQSKSLTS
jgi:hypothetical protein